MWDAQPVITADGVVVPGAEGSGLLAMGRPFGMETHNKKAREVFVGNLLQGQVTQQHIKQFFLELFLKVPQFLDKYPHLVTTGPVVDAQMSSDGKFAFVEFATEELAVTALEFDRCELLGRQIKTGRSNSFVPQGYVPPPLDVTMLRAAGFIQGHVKLGSVNTAETKKQRELFVGQLPVGITAEAVRDLFVSGCQHLPEYRAEMGPPVINVDMSSSNQYCFVEFQSHDLATAAKGIFNDLEVLGKKLTVNRPSGYTPPGTPGPALAAGVTGMQLGGMPQPPALQLQQQGGMIRPLPTDFRVGDWICGGCQNHNFKSKEQCFKCGSPKSQGVGLGITGLEQPVEGQGAMNAGAMAAANFMQQYDGR